ncbi:MAG: phage tail sheath subtilisin-like domain-containing protein [Mariniphaga sp.]|nr:phage tail sheath subtilisin-like domain-containing protein [Mariniphaga sp.]
MATTYYTPGVYIEEISKFPPSIAQVETAIPAFIGYTEKATKKEAGDLSGKPTRITSMLEYETFFGIAKKETDIKVSVVGEVISATPPLANKKSPFLMYYSMQIYFANGGGPCYIVSVDQYGADNASPATLVSFNDLNTGLSAIKKVDEPTLIIFSDATSLASDADFYGIYGNALMQCKDLQDRFTIIDTYSDTEHDTDLSDSDGNPYGTIDPDDSIREGISLGKDYLKYGAVYYPFLETILDYVYDESKIDVTISSSDPVDVKKEVQDISSAISTTALDNLISDLDTMEAGVNAATDDAAAVALIQGIVNNIQNIRNINNGLISKLNMAVDIARNDGTTDTETNALDTWITDVLEATNLKLNQTIDRLNVDDTKSKIENEISDSTANDPSLQRDLGIHSSNVAGDALSEKITTVKETGELKLLIDALPSSGSSSTTSKLDKLETTNNALYNKINSEIGQIPVKLPPSSTMAGVYARVDNDRGVWKAPANVGLTYVIKPSVNVTHEEQEGLNVDTTAGKSINAIRSFTGKGTLVWGARTLAGNDNEWRYVSVRRFFNMVEESVKKATLQFVFEPNDSNTWVKVKAMIGNFLTQLWKAGALAGPTPDKAFYVKVGLGETMTATEILEGYMIIEIGMAAVRPAEFIILRFSHKMQEA